MENISPFNNAASCCASKRKRQRRWPGSCFDFHSPQKGKTVHTSTGCAKCSTVFHIRTYKACSIWYFHSIDAALFKFPPIRWATDGEDPQPANWENLSAESRPLHFTGHPTGIIKFNAHWKTGVHKGSLPMGCDCWTRADGSKLSENGQPSHQQVVWRTFVQLLKKKCLLIYENLHSMLCTLTCLPQLTSYFHFPACPFCAFLV